MALDKRWLRRLRSAPESEQFVQLVNDLQAGVAQLWALDRVIPNFTDHGPRHNSRVTHYLWQLYECRPRQARAFEPLTARELFVLLAGALLHDIGMQCTDPSLLQQVGAQVKAHYPAEYSEDERTQIRKRHHLLSAAMIEEARKESGAYRRELPKLVTSLQAVPADLVTPLTYVAKYHSQLKLKDCPEKYAGTRVRLLAALLRFADELDISRDRISLSEIEVYPRPNESEYWWWIHYFTQTIEITKGEICFHFSLNEDDRAEAPRLERVVKRAFIRKNEPILDEIVREQFALHYAADARWEFDKHLPLLKNDVKKQMYALLQKQHRELLAQLESEDAAVAPPPPLAEPFDTAAASTGAMAGDPVSGAGGVVGSICCLAHDGDELFLVGGGSVLAPGVTPELDSPVFSPPVADAKGGKEIARLARFALATSRLSTPSDSAAARLLASAALQSAVRGIGPIRGLGHAKLGDTVRISGAGSGLTEGLVIVVLANVVLPYEGRTVLFRDLFACSNSTRKGDYGAPVLDIQNRLLGMVVATLMVPEPLTLVLPIKTVTRYLAVDVVVAQAPEYTQG
jgi:hypothetical protein